MQAEIRADKSRMTVTGYVNVTARDSRVLRDASGPYVEQIMPGAFRKALLDGTPVELRFDHDRVLGSTTTGEVKLREDNVGLRADAVVTDTEVIQAAVNNELRGWSFGFVKRQDRWSTGEDGTRRRYVDELELREVSILDRTPAYIATSIETRDEEETLIEFRVMVGEELTVIEEQRESKEEKQSEPEAKPSDPDPLGTVERERWRFRFLEAMRRDKT